MSIEALNWVRYANHIKAPARGVIWALANAARPHPEKGTGDAHICWMSLERIAQESGYCVRSVERALKKANEKGWIKIHSRAHRTANSACNIYEVPVSQSGTTSESISEVPGSQSEVPGSQSEVPDSQSEVPDSQSDKPKEPKGNSKKPSEGIQKSGGTRFLTLADLTTWINKQDQSLSWIGPATILAEEFIGDMERCGWTVQGQPIADGLQVFRGRLKKKGLIAKAALSAPG